MSHRRLAHQARREGRGEGPILRERLPTWGAAHSLPLGPGLHCLVPALLMSRLGLWSPCAWPEGFPLDLEGRPESPWPCCGMQPTFSCVGFSSGLELLLDPASTKVVTRK